MEAIIEVMRERATTYPDYVEGCEYFYRAPSDYDAKAVKKRWKDDSGELLQSYQQRLKECEWNIESLEAQLRAVTEAADCGAGRLIHPARLAVSGVGGGPSLFDMMLLIGRDECVERIERALKVLNGQPA